MAATAAYLMTGTIATQIPILKTAGDDPSCKSAGSNSISSGVVPQFLFTVSIVRSSAMTTSVLYCAQHPDDSSVIRQSKAHSPDTDAHWCMVCGSSANMHFTCYLVRLTDMQRLRRRERYAGCRIPTRLFETSVFCCIPATTNRTGGRQ